MTATTALTVTPQAAPSVLPQQSGPGAELRVVTMVWERELIRFVRTRTRILSGLIQPVLFLFVLGYGLNGLVGSVGGFNFHQFVYPGVVAMSVVMTAMFSALSIVWDREFGFLREMLIAPVERSTLVLGKMLGGATVAVMQGMIMLVLAPLVGINLTVLLVLEMVGLEVLMAGSTTAFGLAIASRISKMESFQVVMQMLLMPMLFLSGTLFPLSGLPNWLTVITRINPLTYAIAPFRQVIFRAQHMTAVAQAHFSPRVTWFGWVLPMWIELGIVVAFATVFFVVAAQGLSRSQ